MSAMAISLAFYRLSGLLSQVYKCDLLLSSDISEIRKIIAWVRARMLRSAPPSPLVIPRESGVSSTLRPFGSIATALEYWIARFRGR
jgi:hypothetical protein